MVWDDEKYELSEGRDRVSPSVTIIMISWADVGLVNNTSLESPAESCQTDIIGAADGKRLSRAEPRLVKYDPTSRELSTGGNTQSALLLISFFLSSRLRFIINIFKMFPSSGLSLPLRRRIREGRAQSFK